MMPEANSDYKQACIAYALKPDQLRSTMNSSLLFGVTVSVTAVGRGAAFRRETAQA